MATQPQSSARLVFGSFEVNVPAGELRKDGVRIQLPRQPLQVLLLLLAHPGDVVTREQLRDTLWNEGTFVDFERGLNSAINKLRRALSDSAEKPRYIETVPGQGYRFVGTIEQRTRGSNPLEANATAVIVDPVSPPAPRARQRRVWLTVVAVAMAFGAGVAVPRLVTKPSSIARPVLQFVISPPAGTIFAPPIGRQPFAISPDGTRLAFTATGSNGTNIWIRDLAALNAWAVPGTEGAWSVFWSPDSRSIFYSVKRSLKQASVATAATRSVANLPLTAMSGAWRSNGDLLLYLGPNVYELLVENGALRELPGADMRWPQFLPRSDRFLHVVFDPTLGRYRALVTDYLSKKSKPLVETDSRIQYAPPQSPRQPGTLLYIRGASLVVQSFDSSRLQLAGEPQAIVQNITYFRPSASACFSVSENGVLVYQAGFPVSELNWYDRAGHVLGAAGRPAPYVGPVRISPDGQRVASTVWSPENGAWDVWLFDANGSESHRLTYPPASHARPVWSPEGTRIAFGASQTGPPRVAILDIAETGKEQALAKQIFPMQASRDQIQLPTDWSSDGRFIAFDTGLGEEEQEVWLIDTSSGRVMPLLRNQFAQWGAVFSRDRTRLAFVSAESGRPEVYVQAFVSIPSPQLIGVRRQVSKQGAWIVRWRADGRELFYVDTDNWLYAVPVKEPLQFGEPQRLFRIAGIPQYGTTSDFQFDVAPDGQRFIMSTTGSATPPPFVVVENWQEKFGR